MGHQGFVKSHKAVTSSTVSKWLKEGLLITEIDSRMFKGHPTRAASTTKADVPEGSVYDVMKKGQLPNNYTFQKFYKKDFIDHSETFQASISSNVL